MQSLEFVLWHSGLKREVVFDQGGGLSRGGLLYCVGTEPSALVYIGILVTSTTTGHDGSVVSALASQAKGGRGSIPSCVMSFSPPSIYFWSDMSGD